VVFVKGSSIPPEKLIILAGAGLSCGAGLPGSIGLAEKFKQTLLSKRGSEDYVTALLMLHFYLEGAIRLQKAKCGLDPAGGINIEELCVAARTLDQRELSPIAPFISGWHPHLESLAKSSGVPDLLAGYINELYRHISDSLVTPIPERISFLERFVEWARVFQGLHFFTLNYDTCLEEAVAPSCQHTEEVALVDGFSDQGGSWNPELFASSGAGLYLYKLHGSLNWFDDPEFGLVCRSKMDPERMQEIEGERPHLIFGIESKLTGQQPFFTLTHKFYERLGKASVLLAIGYSFGDVHINRLIEQTTFLNPSLKILVANQNAIEMINNHEFLRRLRNVEGIDGDSQSLITTGSLLRKAKDLVMEEVDNNEGPPF
jgi:hypothetical protein